MVQVFQPFDARKDFKSTHRLLPHWHQSGATYFVTFRLADSQPAEVRERFKELKQLNDSEVFAWMEHDVDAGSGDCTIGNPVPAEKVTSALLHFDQQRYVLGAFVVMPNHVHVLVQPIRPFTLTSIVHSWKSYTAHALQRQAGINGRVWQEESFDRIVRDEIELRRFNDYILANPSAARLQPGTFIVGRGSAKWLEFQA